MHAIGIDIGGTHTDGVLLDATGKSLKIGKTTTTACLSKGVKTMIEHLLKLADIEASSIRCVAVGSTHATNAILEGKGLIPVGLLRLLDGRPRFPSPGFGWPSGLKEKVIMGWEACEGGYECDGRASSRFNIQEVKEAIDRLLVKGCAAISVAGSFSPLNGDQEQSVGSLIQEMAGKNFPFTLSHQIGGIGLIERENAAILNSALKNVISTGFVSIEKVLKELGIQGPLWLTQNNGSLLALDEALRFPIKTIGAGQTHSFLGASRLCGVHDAIVVDMGGTSTDIGIVEGGYARVSLQAASIGGVSLHFSMPDMISLPLGGGSHVLEKEGRLFQISHQSVARELRNLSKVFGGPILTLTDAGVAAGCLELDGGKGEAAGLSQAEAKTIVADACRQIYQAIVRLRGRRRDLPVILAGGGAPLMQPLLQDFGLDGWMPKDACVANAYGAGMAEISSVSDVVASLKERKKVLEELKEGAKMQAIAMGADPQFVRIAGISILPFAYTPEALAKVVITASGPPLR